MHKCLFVDFSFICRRSRWNMRTLPIIRLVLVILCIYIYTNFVLAYAIGKRRNWEDISNNNLRNRLRIYIWLASYIWKESTKLKSAKDSWIEIVFFLFIFQRRISREGVLNEAGGSMGSEVTAIDLDESMHQLSRGTGNDGSSDPLLQIPTQLSAVLTMKRGGSPKHRRSQSKQINTTPLLKRKRESIVWSSSSWERRNPKFCTTTLSYGRETIQIDSLKYKTTKVHYEIYFLSKDRHTKGCVNH